MKLFAASMLMMCMVFVGCAETATEVSADIANASNKVEASVEGMTCSGCTGEVRAAVESIEGVTAAHADLKTGTVSVALLDDADTEAKKQEIQAVIAGLSGGEKYTVGEIMAVKAGDCSSCETCAEGTCDASDKECCGTCEGKHEHGEEGHTHGEEEPQTNAGETDAVYTASYDVTGMTCTACSSKVTEAVSAIDGVESASVCHMSGKCSIVAKDGVEVCPVMVAEAIESAGFKVAEQQ